MSEVQHQDFLNISSNLRKRIDTVIRTHHTDERLQNHHGYYTVQSLLMAKGWLGKFKKYIGMPTPYTVAQTVQEIPVTDDTSEKVIKLDDDYLVAIYTLRQYTTELIEAMEDFQQVVFKREGIEGYAMISLEASWRHLHEASMHMGFSLQALREEHVDAGVIN